MSRGKRPDGVEWVRGVERDLQCAEAGALRGSRHVVNVLRGTAAQDPDHGHPGESSIEVGHRRAGERVESIHREFTIFDISAVRGEGREIGTCKLTRVPRVLDIICARSGPAVFAAEGGAT